jgi:manganese/iron transport system permease protein
VGIWVSFLIDSAPAPTIVLIMSMVFIVAFIRTTIKARANNRAEASA